MRSNSFVPSIFAAMSGLCCAWGGDVQYAGRAGLYGTPEFTASNGLQYSSFSSYSDSGWLAGHSRRYNGGSVELGQAAWVAPFSTGISLRIGLYDQGGGNQFTSNNGYQFSTLLFMPPLTESGWVTGTSQRYNGGSVGLGNAAWVASASTGTTTRIGLFDQSGGNQFTSSNGTQNSAVDTVVHGATTESGWVTGVSTRYNGGAGDLGQAAWIASASTGVTTRIGLYDQGGGTLFTSSSGVQSSSLFATFESGHAVGSSLLYNGNSSEIGFGVWAASASGGTTRIGLYDAGGGNTYTSDNGAQSSFLMRTTQSGWVSGVSYRYDGGPFPTGATSAWVANVSTGVTTRVGLYDQGGGTQFTNNNGYQNSIGYAMSESGWITGQSERYNGGSESLGYAAWVTSVHNTGTTHRIGLYDQSGGNQFTSDTGTQFSFSDQVTSSGWVSGISHRYNGGAAELGDAAWVASASTGTTKRVGLYDESGGNQFTASDGTQYSYIMKTSESGWAAGVSSRYNGGTEQLGQAAWVASASTGTTLRLGLYDQGGGNRFTKSDGTQDSNVDDVTESGRVFGSSMIFNGTSDFLGQAAWVGDATTGTTIRLGLFDAVHTSIDGRQSTVRFTHSDVQNDEGLIAGFSNRFNGDDTDDGVTGWIFDLTNNTQIKFELSVRPSDGYAASGIYGITDDGLAYGYYTLFSGETDMGQHPFLWSREGGLKIVESEIEAGIAQYGWMLFNYSQAGTTSEFFAGEGELVGQPPGNRGVYIVQAAVPEPSGASLLAFGGLWLGGLRRRARK